MDLLLPVLVAYSVLSTVAFALLCSKKKEDKKQQPAQALSIEAQQIIHDMTAHGQALVRIVPMNPADVFWRSPR